MEVKERYWLSPKDRLRTYLDLEGRFLAVEASKANITGTRNEFHLEFLSSQDQTLPDGRPVFKGQRLRVWPGVVFPTSEDCLGQLQRLKAEINEEDLKTQGR